MKKIICLMMVFAIVLPVCLFVSTAATAPAGYLGDANQNSTIDAIDATYIQRVVAQLEKAEPINIVYGDIDYDKKLTVQDSTYIQRWIAGMDRYSNVGGYINYDMLEHDFYADYESGAAMIGKEVTFTIDASAGSPMQRYELYVDNKLVATSDDNSISYTFENPGVYDIKMCAVAFYATGEAEIRNYEVMPQYESETPLFKTLYSTGKHWGDYIFDKDDMAFHAEAIGGVGPYEYEFTFTRPASERDNTPVVYHRDYSSDNVYVLPEIRFEDFCGYPHTGPAAYPLCELKVSIRDANGSVVSRTEYIQYSDIKIG